MLLVLLIPLLAATLPLGAPVRADEETAASAPPAAQPAAEAVEKGPPRHDVRLRSGTILVGQLEPSDLRLKTPFGELVVPVKDLKRVVFGRRADPERFQRVLDAIADLGAASQERRLSAQAHLAGEGRYAAPDLQIAVKDHADPEVRRAAQELLTAMEIADDEELLPADDVVETSDFALRGNIIAKSFKVTVAELGPIDVRRHDVAEIVRHRLRREVKCVVDGQQTSAGAWFDTKVRFEKGETVRILANGSITYPNWGGQMFDPDGNMNRGMIGSFPMGCLVGRIGENGTMFRVGRSWFGEIERGGILQLAVLINMRGQPSNGEFTVRVLRE